MERFLGFIYPKCVPCTSVDELRPIALTSVISKLQESYVVNWLSEDINSKITETQYGGQSGSSAGLALLSGSQMAYGLRYSRLCNQDNVFRFPQSLRSY